VFADRTKRKLCISDKQNDTLVLLGWRSVGARRRGKETDRRRFLRSRLWQQQRQVPLAVRHQEEQRQQEQGKYMTHSTPFSCRIIITLICCAQELYSCVLAVNQPDRRVSWGKPLKSSLYVIEYQRRLSHQANDLEIFQPALTQNAV
jgi:hypothetical protein